MIILEFLLHLNSKTFTHFVVLFSLICIPFYLFNFFRILSFQVLRVTAITENTFEIFNNFMKDVVKEMYSKMPRYKPFWLMVAEKGITLISNSENSGSKITHENALKFLSLEVLVVADIVQEVVIEDDDMFGEME